VADNSAAALADDHSARLLNHDPIALALLSASATHIIKTPRTILRRWRHKSALGLRGR
jgi:hypothetical protein